ncbi:MAG: hypothetical protein AAGG65_06250 [Pseudomonadota bacterium]
MKRRRRCGREIWPATTSGTNNLISGAIGVSFLRAVGLADFQLRLHTAAAQDGADATRLISASGARGARRR